MVRLITPIPDSKPVAMQDAIELAADLAATSATVLPEFIPD